MGLGSFSPHDWALIWLGSGLSPLGLFCFVQYGVMLCLFAHFECIFYVFRECPPANGQTSKLVKIVSSKALCLSFSVCMLGFYASVGG